MSHEGAQSADTPLCWLLATARGYLAAEEARRQPIEPEPITYELWAQVDQGALDQARRKLRGGVQLVAKAAAPAGADDPTVPNPARLFAKLHELKAQRQAGAA